MTPNQQTLRVTGLPAAATEDDVNHFFQVFIRQPGTHIQAIGPFCKEADKTTYQTTVTFASRDLARQALQLDHRSRRLTAARGGFETINLDSDFKDMTTLQSLANPKTGEPDIEYVQHYIYEMAITDLLMKHHQPSRPDRPRMEHLHSSRSILPRSRSREGE